MNRRDFSKRMAGLVAGSRASALWPAANDITDESPDAERAQDERSGASTAEDSPNEAAFPEGSYTPYGYLDNPYHCWTLNRSGNLRSVEPVGFGWYCPAGPDGYFDYERQYIYAVTLRLGVQYEGKSYFEPAGFQGAGLRSSYHSKNIFTFNFTIGALDCAASFFQVSENTLAARVTVENRSAAGQDLDLIGAVRLQFGPPDWWGRDGIAGSYDAVGDQVILHSFAAGPAFALTCDRPSARHILTADDRKIADWIASPGENQSQVTSYFPAPMNAAETYPVKVASRGSVECSFYLSRSADIRKLAEESERSRRQSSRAFSARQAEDGLFWERAPRLEGDFPEYWKNGWIYDFETLRMMVRRPVGVYKHPWDAMQIQAPRNVLAETSIDMWVLAYADPETAKAVLLGQFQDAVARNVPCMREDGTMNMVAADGSECGTALSWCYPCYCIESVFLRTGDREWAGALYPHLKAHLEWILANRRDRDGWIVAKCSWETGMDANSRFLIKQPTGGEVIDFIRVPELQAAMAHAAGMLANWAEMLGRREDLPRWHELRSTYVARSRQLFHQDWFYDVDARSGQFIVIPGQRVVTQVGPVMCAAATPDQVQAMIPNMNWYAGHQQGALDWPSQVLPYAESMWAAEQRRELAALLHGIADRVYRATDRRRVDHEAHLGMPGVSREMWDVEKGTGGAEGYGWGATMPAHIIRGIFGFREDREVGVLRFALGPNLPDSLTAQGKSFGLRNVAYRGQRFDLRYETATRDELQAEISFPRARAPRAVKVTGQAGEPQSAGATPGGWRFKLQNHALYSVELEV